MVGMTSLSFLPTSESQKVETQLTHSMKKKVEMPLASPLEVEDWRGREAKKGKGMIFATFLLGFAIVMYQVAVMTSELTLFIGAFIMLFAVSFEIAS
jgi:hypothetical protein